MLKETYMTPLIVCQMSFQLREILARKQVVVWKQWNHILALVCCKLQPRM
uniref:Uncharacterized protein n=1 Tax=Arundo donax TaxID=35708 RepID=A0A0A9A230_ARUDO